MIKKKPKAQSENTNAQGGNKKKQSILRFQRDIKNFVDRKQANKELPNVRLEFPNENSQNPCHIIVQPQNGFYKNSRITFIYTIPENYPYEGPIVQCKQRVFHPNIDLNRKVCLSILKTGWQANNELIEVAYGIWQILEGLNHADIEKPLDAVAASLMKQNPKAYQQVVEKTLKGQSYNGQKFDNVWIGK